MIKYHIRIWGLEAKNNNLKPHELNIMLRKIRQRQQQGKIASLITVRGRKRKPEDILSRYQRAKLQPVGPHDPQTPPSVSVATPPPRTSFAVVEHPALTNFSREPPPPRQTSTPTKDRPLYEALTAIDHWFQAFWESYVDHNAGISQVCLTSELLGDCMLATSTAKDYRSKEALNFLQTMAQSLQEYLKTIRPHTYSIILLHLSKFVQTVDGDDPIYSLQLRSRPWERIIQSLS